MPKSEKIQYGALPYRINDHEKLEVLLITSRETGRWVIPKGNPIKGLSGYQTALQEAFEEAGAVGNISETAIGDYLYWKRGKSSFVLYQVFCYPLK